MRIKDVVAVEANPNGGAIFTLRFVGLAALARPGNSLGEL